MLEVFRLHLPAYPTHLRLQTLFELLHLLFHDLLPLLRFLVDSIPELLSVLTMFLKLQTQLACEVKHMQNLSWILHLGFCCFFG